MATLSQLLNTARDALAAQSFGLGAAGQNIANVATPGYTRREAQLETRALGTQTTGGVEIKGLKRVTDQYVERRHLGRQERLPHAQIDGVGSLLVVDGADCRRRDVTYKGVHREISRKLR